MNKLLLLHSTVLSVVISSEICYDKFCYSWDERYETLRSAKKCQYPYWELEIYNDDILWDVKQFITSKKLSNNYAVPLGLTCKGTYCEWKKLNIRAEFNKVHSNYFNVVPAPQDPTVFFTIPYVSSWHLQNIGTHQVAVICMRSKDASNQSTNKQNDSPKEQSMLIIGVVLGLASLALVMLLIALLVVVFRRKRNRLKSTTTRSRSFENYRIVNPVNSPASLQSLDHADVLPPSEPSSNYVNPLNLPISSAEPTNILYADLDWSAEPDSRAIEISASKPPDSKAEETGGLYENHSSFKIVGPLGDEYALVNKCKLINSD